MKKNLLSKILILILVLVTVVAFAACNKNKKKDNTPTGPNLDEVVTKTPPTPVYPSYNGPDTLVAGYSYFSNKFSPFFSKTGYDQDVAAMTQVSLLTIDRLGNLILNGIDGETTEYNGTEYLYQGIADFEIVRSGETGPADYKITIRDDLFFSDGVHMTIDDVIFSMYVLCDPSYDGSSTLYASPIKGIKEYRTGVTPDVYEKYVAIAADLLEAGYSETPTLEDFTQGQFDTYWGEALNNAGLKFTQEIIDYVFANYNNAAYEGYMGKYSVQEITGNEALQIAYGMRMWGFGSWLNDYEKDDEGTLGLVGDVYKSLYTPCAEADKAFQVLTGDYAGFYKAAVAATEDEDLFYITTNNPAYLVAPYSGDRYVAVPNGDFVDALDNVYDFETTFPTVEDYWTNILESYGYDLSDDGINYESAGSSIRDLVAEEFIKIEGPKDPAMQGKAINSIEGIKKTGNYSMTVTTTEFDVTTIYQLGISVAPLHYYGSRSAYKYTENKFGFTKGDLSGVKAKTTEPMGAGPYKFVSFEMGSVTFERNPYYFKGCPKLTNIIFKETADADKVPGVAGTTFDVTDPSFNAEAVAAIKTENTNGQLSGDKLVTSIVENLGYGYIGINADNVKVGTDKKSDESKNLRRAFATLFAIYREYAVNSYYGDLATVINYPISNTSWAAPIPTDEDYQIAYSKDVEGNPIYDVDDSDAQKWAKALNAAKGFFIEAGYTWNEAQGKFTAAPDGAKLVYEVIIPGDSIGDHPSFAILTAVKAALATIGITLEINDPANSNVLWTALEAGEAEMWCAAWGATIDPDMYQVYYSTNVVGLGGTDSNHYGIQDATLDELIMAARKSDDNSFRKATYKDCFEIIMDWAVEVPYYQRKNAILFNNTRVNMETVTPDITTFWGWMNAIKTLERK